MTQRQASADRIARFQALIPGASSEEMVEIVRAALRAMPEGLAVAACADWAAVAGLEFALKAALLERMARGQACGRDRSRPPAQGKVDRSALVPSPAAQ